MLMTTNPQLTDLKHFVSDNNSVKTTQHDVAYNNPVLSKECAHAGMCVHFSLGHTLQSR